MIKKTIFGIFIIISLLALYSTLTPLNLFNSVKQVEAQVSPPNVVLIVTDDQDLASMAFMPKTNQLLKDQGTNFTNGFVSNSLCCPSRASVLTGQYSHNNGVWSNGGTLGGYSKLDHTNTLAIWLQSAGYYTTHVGKYLNGYGNESPQTEVPPGWDEWYTGIQVLPMDPYNFILNENGTVVAYNDDGSHANHGTDVLNQKAVDFINRHATSSAQPFYLQLDHPAPHQDDTANNGPLPPLRYENTFDSEPLPTSKPSFNEASVSDKPSYISTLPLMNQADIDSLTTHYRDRLESLQAVDDSVEAVVNALSSNGMLDNTYIIFTSDNGYFLGEHRIKKGKTHMHEESIKVPLIIRGPNVPVQTVDKFVTNIDLAPTIVSWTNATPQRVMDGLSLVPLLQNPLANWRGIFLLEGDNKQYTGLRGDIYSYTERSDGQFEWYNLLTDPYQLTAFRGLVPIFHETLIDLETCSGASCNQGLKIFFDDFQTGNFGTKWVESNELDWNVAGYIEKNVPEYPSNNKVARANACTSSGGCILTLNNAVDLTTYTNPKLKFWRYVDNDLDSGEFLKVEVYDGVNWIQIFNWTDGAGDDDTWHKEIVDLTAYLNTQFKVRFTTKMSSSAEDTQIDNVSIEGSTP